jgi:hypothetical protein
MIKEGRGESLIEAQAEGRIQVLFESVNMKPAARFQAKKTPPNVRKRWYTKRLKKDIFAIAKTGAPGASREVD